MIFKLLFKLFILRPIKMAIEFNRQLEKIKPYDCIDVYPVGKGVHVVSHKPINGRPVGSLKIDGK